MGCPVALSTGSPAPFFRSRSEIDGYLFAGSGVVHPLVFLLVTPRPVVRPHHTPPTTATPTPPRPPPRSTSVPLPGQQVRALPPKAYGGQHDASKGVERRLTPSCPSARGRAPRCRRCRQCRPCRRGGRAGQAWHQQIRRQPHGSSGGAPPRRAAPLCAAAPASGTRSWRRAGGGTLGRELSAGMLLPRPLLQLLLLPPRTGTHGLAGAPRCVEGGLVASSAVCTSPRPLEPPSQ